MAASATSSAGSAHRGSPSRGGGGVRIGRRGAAAGTGAGSDPEAEAPAAAMPSIIRVPTRGWIPVGSSVLSNNVAGAREFYGRLFGWTSVDTSFEPFASYTVMKRGDIQEGGILPIGRDWDVSPTWNSIFAVDDCDATIARAKALGGSSIFVHTVPKHGRFGSLRDPGGAVFVIRGPVPGSQPARDSLRIG